MLSVVPNRGGSVAVVVTHDEAFSVAEIREAGRSHADRFDKEIHQTVVEGSMFVGVTVVLIAGYGLRPGQAKGRLGIWIGNQQRAAQTVDRRRAGGRSEYRFARSAIDGVGIRGEVVIEGNIFLEDDNHMLDRSGGSHGRSVAAVGTDGNRRGSDGGN